MGPHLHAGAAKVALELPLGCPMMGYGARQGTAAGHHDPLAARALSLRGAGRALIVELDLCLMAVSQARMVRQRIAEATGLALEQILVGCTHTHSGPDTGLGHVLAKQPVPPHVESLLDAAVAAGIEAVANEVPARMAGGLAPVAIGRNRRSESGPVDEVARVLRVDGADGSVLCIAHWHGCHPTAMGHDNLEYSADWPGVAEAVVADAFPDAVVLFGLGAHADVDPRTRGLLDLAIPLQSVGVGFEEMAELGREYGHSVAAVAEKLRPVDDPRVAARSSSVALTVQGCPGDESARATHLTELRARALAALDLPPDSDARISDLYRLEDERTKGLPAEEVRERLSRVREYLRDRTAPRFAGGARVDVEALVIRIGDMWLLGLPVECCVDVGRDWAARVGGVGSTVTSIANGWLRYLPATRHFGEPRAIQKYEILNATFSADAAEQLIDAGAAMAAEMARPAVA